MRYVEARIEQERRDEAYRIYMSKSLQLVPQRKYLQLSYSELLDTKKADTRSGDEIAMDVMERAGLSFSG